MHSSAIVAETGRFLPQLAQVIKVQLTLSFVENALNLRIHLGNASWVTAQRSSPSILCSKPFDSNGSKISCRKLLKKLNVNLRVRNHWDEPHELKFESFVPKTKAASFHESWSREAFKYFSERGLSCTWRICNDSKVPLPQCAISIQLPSYSSMSQNDEGFSRRI